jgi:hypothetical protein
MVFEPWLQNPRDLPAALLLQRREHLGHTAAVELFPGLGPEESPRVFPGADALQIVRTDLHHAQVRLPERVVVAQPTGIIEQIQTRETDLGATPADQRNFVLLEQVGADLHGEIQRIRETVADGCHHHRGATLDPKQKQADRDSQVLPASMRDVGVSSIFCAASAKPAATARSEGCANIAGASRRVTTERRRSTIVRCSEGFSITQRDRAPEGFNVS